MMFLRFFISLFLIFHVFTEGETRPSWISPWLTERIFSFSPQVTLPDITVPRFNKSIAAPFLVICAYPAIAGTPFWPLVLLGAACLTSTAAAPFLGEGLSDSLSLSDWGGSWGGRVGGSYTIDTRAYIVNAQGCPRSMRNGPSYPVIEYTLGGDFVTSNKSLPVSFFKQGCRYQELSSCRLPEGELACWKVKDCRDPRRKKWYQQKHHDVFVLKSNDTLLSVPPDVPDHCHPTLNLATDCVTNLAKRIPCSGGKGLCQEQICQDSQEGYLFRRVSSALQTRGNRLFPVKCPSFVERIKQQAVSCYEVYQSRMIFGEEKEVLWQTEVWPENEYFRITFNFSASVSSTLQDFFKREADYLQSHIQGVKEGYPFELSVAVRMGQNMSSQTLAHAFLDSNSKGEGGRFEGGTIEVNPRSKYMKNPLFFWLDHTFLHELMHLLVLNERIVSPDMLGKSVDPISGEEKLFFRMNVTHAECPEKIEFYRDGEHLAQQKQYAPYNPIATSDFMGREPTPLIFCVMDQIGFKVKF